MERVKQTIEPRIGLFFTPYVDGRFDILERSQPLTEIDCIAGFRTYPEGHLDVWKQETKKQPELHLYPYEYFPRGRVNWREEDDTYLFLADRIVFDQKLHESICLLWHLNGLSVKFMLDSHYKTTEFHREWQAASPHQPAG